MREFDEILCIYFKYVFVYNNWVLVCLKLGNFFGVIVDCYKVLKINFNYGLVYYNLGLIYIEMGDLE